MSTDDVAIIGIGMHPFGRHDGVSGLEQGAVAARAALQDAGVPWGDIGISFGGSDAAGNADALIGHLGLTGAPFVNVRNGCATGGTALLMAANAIRAGEAEIAMAVGFDKHPRGAFDPDPEAWGLGRWYGETGLMLTTQFFAMKIQRYLHDHRLDPAILALVASKAFDNGADNPNAWRRQRLSPEEVAASPMISHPLTQYMFCSPGEGAAALILCRGDLAPQLSDRPVYLRAAAYRSRRYGSFEVFAPWLALERGPSPSTDAAAAAFERAGIAPEAVDVAQVQDTESGAEIMHMAETGLCKDGEQDALLRSGATRSNGQLPINTDGGCLANGEPIGASGLRQIHENVLQLRGAGGARQVGGTPTIAFSHVYGAPGISACTVLST